ncbi:hypothetical protein LSG31_08130 [Fodinisporobacter ferrooxydans]|uniref:Uncharacterized protein n=1 Tax=Fodinisporobacter ferrooxydans TaxID=2901836 RepID=A0ABY4CRV5_9BACL|nr:hypothetical protein LSG31_08130 [Alicyclobacillaceae bacterium MYW30-H2]
MRNANDIAQELEDLQEQLCELYSKRRALEKEYQTAVLRFGLEGEYETAFYGS